LNCYDVVCWQGIYERPMKRRQFLISQAQRSGATSDFETDIGSA